MINGILWLIVGGLIGAGISVLMAQGAAPRLFLDILAGSGGAFATGLVFALLGIHSLTSSHLSFFVLAASGMGAWSSVAIVNLVFEATHSSGQ